MEMGNNGEEGLAKGLDQQSGQNAGVHAGGKVEGNVFSPQADPGIKHWPASYTDHDGLRERDNIFFVSVAMTRMLTVVIDRR